jgi:hypothetical protein
MRHPTFRHLATAGALALIAAAPLAACGAEPLAPLPAQAASAEPTDTASHAPAVRPSASATTGSSPPRVAAPPAGQQPAPARPKPKTTKKTPRPSSPSTCFGAVQHDLDLQNTVLDLQQTMCFHTGGVLRLQGIGPGLVTATPSSVVSSNYEGAVVDLRFIRPGTATVTIPQDEQTHTITVVVVS